MFHLFGINFIDGQQSQRYYCHIANIEKVSVYLGLVTDGILFLELPILRGQFIFHFKSISKLNQNFYLLV